MATSTWISQVGSYPVTRIELPFGGSDVRTWGKGVLHTTEGYSADGAVDTFRANGYCPHFTVGAKVKGGKPVIYQHRSLAVRSTTLRSGGNPDNNIAARVQIEAVGFSSTSLWSFAPTTEEPLAQLLAWLSTDLEPEPIPLARPKGYKDDCSDISGTWATTSNSRRADRLLQADGFRGWLMHLEAVENTHWDAGALRWTDLLALARAAAGGPPEDDMDQDTFNSMLAKALEVTSIGDVRYYERALKALADGSIPGRSDRSADIANPYTAVYDWTTTRKPLPDQAATATVAPTAASTPLFDQDAPAVRDPGRLGEVVPEGEAPE